MCHTLYSGVPYNGLHLVCKQSQSISYLENVTFAWDGTHQRDTQVAPPTAASIVANGVQVNGKAPEPEAAAADKPAPVEDKDDASKVEAKEDGEEVRCGVVVNMEQKIRLCPEITTNSAIWRLRAHPRRDVHGAQAHSCILLFKTRVSAGPVLLSFSSIEKVKCYGAQHPNVSPPSVL